MRIFFVSLGCDKNLVDSEVMLGVIKSAGHEIVFNKNDAEIVVVNTCAFISDAVSEGIEVILELARLKRDGKLKALIIAGCIPARYRDEIFKDIPEADAIIGPDSVETIAEVICRLAGTTGEKISCFDPPAEKSGSSARVLATPGHYAYLKIAEGCDNHCTYCTIPSIRGGYRSRDMDALVAEAEGLAGIGVRELILVAQDTSLYGMDLYGEPVLHKLLSGLAGVNGIERLRVLYCYPEHITDALIAEIADNPKVCKYLDIPIQHADDRILRLMGRVSTRAGLADIITRLRKAVPGIALRTTVIVGFPGEGDSEYEELKLFVTEIGFDKLGAFAYSREQGTPAYKLPLQVKAAVKRKRVDDIMLIQRQVSSDKRKTYIGATLPVMVDGFLPEDGVYCGRSYMDAPDIDGLVFFKHTGELVSGDTVNILITGSADYDLIGEIVREPS